MQHKLYSPINFYMGSHTATESNAHVSTRDVFILAAVVCQLLALCSLMKFDRQRLVENFLQSGPTYVVWHCKWFVVVGEPRYQMDVRTGRSRLQICATDQTSKEKTEEQEEEDEEKKKAMEEAEAMAEEEEEAIEKEQAVEVEEATGEEVDYHCIPSC